MPNFCDIFLLTWLQNAHFLRISRKECQKIDTKMQNLPFARG